MTFNLDSEIAKKYGIDEAVFIQSMYWWISHNRANNKHLYDGRHWTYNSMESLTELFPFWSVKQIRRIVKKLSDQGALLIGNYNKVQFDRTQWYSLSDEILQYYDTGRFDLADQGDTKTDDQTGIFEVPKRANEKCPNGQMRSAQTGRPIPVIYTVNNTVNNNPLTPLDDFSPKMQEKIADWLNYKKEHRKSYKPTGLKSLLTQIKNKVDQHGEQAVCQLIDLCMANNWQGIIWDRIADVKKSAPRVYDEPDFLTGG
ncbi:MAG TPA: hypothetical protein GX701_04460 [Clostridiales bacterium]|nr:hypothetical protein [Clostridiales bacterium]